MLPVHWWGASQSPARGTQMGRQASCGERMVKATAGLW